MTSAAVCQRTTRAAAQLISRCPPRRSRENMNIAEELACATYEAELEANELPVEPDDLAAFRLNFLDAMVERVDQRVEPLLCAHCASTADGSASLFIASEYNRIGDCYRCPRCQHLSEYASDGGQTTAASQPPQSRFVRYVEHAANHVLGSYVRLYYANKHAVHDEVVTSTYAWLPADEEEGAQAGSDEEVCPSTVGIAVYILHRHNGDAEQDGGGNSNEDDANAQKCQWVSAHVAQARPSASGTRFDFQSTVMVDIAQTGASTGSRLGKQRVHGLVSTQSATFTGRPVTIRSSSSAVRQVALALVADLCEHLQRVENALRDVMEALYIGKVGTMMAYSLRLHGGATTTKTTTAPPAESSDHGHEDAEAGAPASGTWEACLDEEGNRYYYHTVTGETSWDLPAASADGAPPPVVAAPPAEATTTSAAAPEGANPAMTVLEILESLSLSQPAEGYYKALRKYLKRFYDMKLDHDALLQLDDPGYTLGEGEDGSEGEQRQVLEVLVPVFGDRRKIRKWIAHRRAELDEGGE